MFHRIVPQLKLAPSFVEAYASICSTSMSLTNKESFYAWLTTVQLGLSVFDSPRAILLWGLSLFARVEVCCVCLHSDWPTGLHALK